jgi:hypothetical protein
MGLDGALPSGLCPTLGKHKYLSIICYGKNGQN